MEGDALRLGTVVDERRLTIAAHGAHIDLGLDELVAAWAGHVPGVRA